MKAFARRAFAAPAAFVRMHPHPAEIVVETEFKIDTGGSVQRLAWGPRHFLRGLKCLVRAGYGALRVGAIVAAGMRSTYSAMRSASCSSGSLVFPAASLA